MKKYEMKDVMRKERTGEAKAEAKAYALKLIELAETVKDLSKSKNGRYEFCGDLGGKDKKIHIFNGLANLAEDLGIKYLCQVESRNDAYEFEYLGYKFFQIMDEDIIDRLGDMVSVRNFFEYTRGAWIY